MNISNFNETFRLFDLLTFNLNFNWVKQPLQLQHYDFQTTTKNQKKAENADLQRFYYKKTKHWR